MIMCTNSNFSPPQFMLSVLPLFSSFHSTAAFPCRMNSTALSIVKLENHLAHESLYFEEQPSPRAWEQYPLFPGSLDELSWDNSRLPCLEFKDFDDICSDFGMWEDVNKSFFEENIVTDDKPMNAAGEMCDQFIENIESVFGDVSNNGVSWIEPVDWEGRPQSGRYKSSALKLDEIQKYFDVPITKAAKELKVGLTVLKKRCRELNIMRWPHRKIKSLKSLINNAKELGLTNEIEMLEEHKRMVQKLPELELSERTKKLRQACFKANYKKRRALAALG